MVLLGYFYSLWQLAFKEHPWLVLFYFSVHQALKGPTSLGSFSVDHLLVPASGEREATVTVASIVSDSEVAPCLHCCLAFLPKAFPTNVSFLLSPHAAFLQSTAVLTLGFFSHLHTTAPNCCTSGELSSLSRVHRSDNCSVMPDSLQPQGL